MDALCMCNGLVLDCIVVVRVCCREFVAAHRGCTPFLGDELWPTTIAAFANGANNVLWTVAVNVLPR